MISLRLQKVRLQKVCQQQVLQLRNRGKDRGYLLLSVSLGLIVLSMFALTALEIGNGEAQLRVAKANATNARYAAEAGVARARWHLSQNGTCGGYPDLGETLIDEFKVSASIAPDRGSPVAILSRSLAVDGAETQLQSEGVAVFRTPETLLLDPGAALDDGWADGDDAGKKNGNDDQIRVGASFPRIGFLKFDTSRIPVGVRVLNAALELNFEGATQADPGGLVTAYPMRESWVEAEASFNRPRVGDTWEWPDAYQQSEPIDSLELATQAVGPVAFDITRLVRAWLAGELPNHGVALASAEGVLNARFTSSDDNNVSEHPKLRVNYACECGRVCALGAGALEVLLFVEHEANPDPQDERRIELLESWGYNVAVVDDDALPAELIAAAAAADVGYVSSTVKASKLLGDLAALPIGLVSEQAELLQEIGLASNYGVYSVDSNLITVVSHYITMGMISNQNVQLTLGNEDLHVLRGAIAADAERLATEPGGSGEPSLATLDAGGLREDGTLGLARRVNLPWAGKDDKFDVRDLTTEGEVILRRALEWASVTAGRFPGFHDSFSGQTCATADDYSGSVGQLDWAATLWQENADDNLSCAGKIRLGDDPAYLTGGDKRLVIAGNAELAREVDLSAQTNAFLRFRARRVGTTDSSEQVRVLASSDGVFYTQIGLVAGSVTDINYVGYEFDITPYLLATTHIKFEGSGLSETALVYIDEVSITDIPL